MTTAIANPTEIPRASAPPRFSPRLLFKITLPYVALALVLALAVIYIVARMNAESVASAWSRQVSETQLRVADSVVRTEQSQLADARTLARLSGLAQAVRAGDRRAALGLAEPYAVSQNIERVVVLNTAGQTVGGLQLDDHGARAFDAGPQAATWPFVAAVLGGDSDKLGDKYVGLVTGADPALYTVVPLYDGTSLVGALLIGTSAPTLVGRWRAASLADVTLYDTDGRPIASSFGADAPPALAPNRQSTPRELTLGSRSYTEVATPLQLRSGNTPQFVGVALSSAGRSDLLDNAEILLLGILAAGLVTAILVGTTISRRITHPITALAQAAEGVANGSLDQQLPITTRDEVGALTHSFNTMVEGLRERERMHDIFGRFVSPTVAQLVLSRPIALSGESKLLTILFTDLRDFTAITEREDPSVVISSLNDYFQIVVEAADRHGGIVNKFGGDSTLVLFGLTDDQGDTQASAAAAVRTAIEIRIRLAALNQQRLAAQLPALIAGIGVNTGSAIAGLIGAERRMEYTVIGDAVNLSARIQALSRELGDGILISEATRMALGAAPELGIVDHGIRHVKGKQQGVRIYAVYCWENRHVA